MEGEPGRRFAMKGNATACVSVYKASERASVRRAQKQSERSGGIPGWVVEAAAPMRGISISNVPCWYD